MVTAKDSLKGLLNMATHFYVSDLNASTSDVMAAKPGGAHRCPFDFTYELVKLNAAMAARLRGETPPPSGGGEHGFMTAPPEFCNVESASKAISASMDEVIAAVDALDDEGLLESVELFGRPFTKMQVATLCGVHMAYHDGQLNYVQTAHGDLGVHWGG